jgi:hypothetical protein
MDAGTDMEHIPGAPCRLQTHAKMERCHQALKTAS